MAVSVTDIQIATEVSQFITKPHQMLIDGKWVDAASGKTFPVYNPATGEVLTQVAEGDKEDIERAVKAARKAFDSAAWREMPPSERGRLIWKLADLIEAHADEFAQLEALDNGKSVLVARAADVVLAVDIFRYMAGWATKIEGNIIPLSHLTAPGAKFLAYTLREPIGVVGQIIPWNFPLLLAAWKLAPALSVGCTIVLKPAEQTPLSALRLGELILEAGFPAGVVNIVPGYGETAGAALAGHPDVDKVAFTGSTEVGQLIVRAAIGNLKKLTLELGGKSPNIVFKDADLSNAIPGSALAIFFNHGQVCCAGSRLYVEQDIFDQVIEGVGQEAKKIKLGSGFDPTATMGPLVSEEQLNRVCGYLESGFTQGAQAVVGGHRYGERGYFVEPTVLVNTRQEMKIVQEEIFGPVIVAQPFTHLEEVPPLANGTIYGLAAGIWTNDLAKAHRLVTHLRAGTVWINCYDVLDAALPFGGYKESGWGREMGHEVLENYLEVKSVCLAL